MATAAWDGQIKLWELGTGRELATLTGQLVGFIGLSISPDGSRLMAGAWDGSLTLWDMVTHQQVGVGRLMRATATGRALWTAGNPGELRGVRREERSVRLPRMAGTRLGGDRMGARRRGGRKLTRLPRY
jgi:WD40 repeat protein